jgi:prevent-host-death family protein
VKNVAFTEARAQLSDLLDLVETTREHVVISRSGKDVALLLSVDEYDSLIETIDALSDVELMADLAESDADVKAGRVIPWEQVKRELGRD